MTRQAISAVALLMASATATAQTSDDMPVLSATHLYIAQGSVGTIELNMESIKDFSDFQLDIKLPESGFSFVEDTDGNVVMHNTDRTSTHTMFGNFQTDGAYRVAAASFSGIKIPAGSGAIMTIEIQTDAEPGEYEFSVYTIEVSYLLENGTNVKPYNPEPFTGKITVLPPNRYGDNQLYARDLTINKGEDAHLLIGYNSSSDVYEYKTGVTLPEGAEVTAVTFLPVVADVENFTNGWSVDGQLLTVNGEYGGGRRDVPAEGGDQIFADVAISTSSLAPGTYNIVLGSQMLSNDDDDYEPDSYTVFLTVTGDPIDSKRTDDGNGWIITGDIGEITDEVAGDADANIYDATGVGAAHLDITVANPNALVISGGNVSSNANDITRNIDDTLWAVEITIDGNVTAEGKDHPFNFSYDIACDKSAYERDNTSEFVTAVLPFAVETWGTGFGQLSSIDGTTMHFGSVSGVIPAYTPFMFKADGTHVSFGGGDISAIDGELSGNGRFHVVELPVDGWYAVYVTKTQVVDDVETDDFLKDYNIYGFQGGNFVRATKKLTSRPFRVFYMEKKISNPACVSSYAIRFDGDDPTSIESLESENTVEDTHTYTLQGLKAGANARGIVIRNNEKIIVK